MNEKFEFQIQYILIHQVVQDYINGVYKDEPVYENASAVVQDPVYENTSFTQQPTNGNGVVNQALINPSDDGKLGVVESAVVCFVALLHPCCCRFG